MTIPNLAGVITKADIDTKGSGSYAASYVSWAKVAHLLHTHASGWEFHLKPDPEGELLWAAPDNTAYVIGFFTGPDGEEATADFPFPVMDNRNNPVPLDKVSARILTDTHRRALCAAAAFTFGLAYELWAKDEIENPHREEKATSKPAPVVITPAQASTKPTAKEPDKEVEFARDEDVKAIKSRIQRHAKSTQIIEQFREYKGLPEGHKRISLHIQFPADIEFLSNLCNQMEDA